MSTTSTNDPLVGSVLDGRYEICSRIARGGMAIVYLAQDLRLARTVAVKVMHEGLGHDADFARKFDREARAAARMAHPNVVAVFDQGIDGGRPYIVMEYVEGSTLRNLIAREAPLEPRRALDIMEPVLAALAAAHNAGLVHRDVKPENVLISDRGQVKVADFGLAKAISGDTATATQGLLIGTVSYIPPELVEQGKADAASDVYSAGIVLFEMLTGRKPFTGDSPIQIAYAHCQRDVPAPSSLVTTSWLESRKAIPPYVDALVMAAAGRVPDRRPRDAKVFLDHLRLAKQALERGIMNDPRLDAEMWKVSDLEDVTAVVPAPPVEPRTIVLKPPAPGRPRWVARGRSGSIAPATPISPVDFEPTMDGMPYYDDVDTEDTPVDLPKPTPRPPAVVPSPVPVPVRLRAGAPRRRRWRGIVALLVVLALAAGTGYGAWYLLAGQYTYVPTLVTRTRADAVALGSASRTPVTFTEAYSETVPKGVVISTNPDGGAKVQQDTGVKAVLSLGPERYGVPTLVGSTKDAATAALQRGHLAVGLVTQRYDAKIAVGMVLAASRKPGELLKPGTPVDLVVSQGPKPIAFATVTGKPLAGATLVLQALGFVVTSTEANSRTVAKGVVISQSPDKGEGKKGDSVALVVSRGPVMVTVPTTRSMKADEAQALLESKGFVVAQKALPNPVPFGWVSYSDPAGGDLAPEGSLVTLYVL